MQVATLFREATSLLDAGMEEGSHLKMGGFQDNNVMKAENVHDDGYETAGATDMEISKHPHQHHHQSLNHHHHHNHNMELASSLATHVKEEPMMKYEMPEDPYSFVDDDHMIAPVQCSPMMHQLPKKRGRKKKIKSEDISLHNSMGYQGIMNCLPSHMKEPGMKMVKERKKHDRFNGMPEEEVSKRTLPDHLTQNLDIVIIGINPGLFAAYKGHHYAGPGNHFWKCLYLSGLTPEPMTADDDYKLLKAGIGFTNMVERATKGSADLTRKEIKEDIFPRRKCG
uniref:G/T mismatch-specific thymine DNA glycosylase n=2 Tax=Lygus hesperus TaxID=30085 RepID=A0A0A9YX15_LYGHE